MNGSQVEKVMNTQLLIEFRMEEILLTNILISINILLYIMWEVH